MVLGIAKWGTALYIKNYTVLCQNSVIEAGQWYWGLQGVVEGVLGCGGRGVVEGVLGCGGRGVGVIVVVGVVIV